MVSEEEIIIAFLFKRSGKETLTPPELYLPLSMDLKWFTPQQAKDFIKLAEKKKLLNKKNNLIKPNFDYKKINIPLSFQP